MIHHNLSRVIAISLLMGATLLGAGCVASNTKTTNNATTNSKSSNATVRAAQEALDEYNASSSAVTNAMDQNTTGLDQAVNQLSNQ